VFPLTGGYRLGAFPECPVPRRSHSRESPTFPRLHFKFLIRMSSSQASQGPWIALNRFFVQGIGLRLVSSRLGALLPPSARRKVPGCSCFHRGSLSLRPTGLLPSCCALGPLGVIAPGEGRLSQRVGAPIEPTKAFLIEHRTRGISSVRSSMMLR